MEPRADFDKYFLGKGLILSLLLAFSTFLANQSLAGAARIVTPYRDVLAAKQSQQVVVSQTAKENGFSEIEIQQVNQLIALLIEQKTVAALNELRSPESDSLLRFAGAIEFEQTDKLSSLSRTKKKVLALAKIFASIGPNGPLFRKSIVEGLEPVVFRRLIPEIIHQPSHDILVTLSIMIRLEPVEGFFFQKILGNIKDSSTSTAHRLFNLGVSYGVNGVKQSFRNARESGLKKLRELVVLRNSTLTSTEVVEGYTVRGELDKGRRSVKLLEKDGVLYTGKFFEKSEISFNYELLWYKAFAKLYPDHALIVVDQIDSRKAIVFEYISGFSDSRRRQLQKEGVISELEEIALSSMDQISSTYLWSAPGDPAVHFIPGETGGQLLNLATAKTLLVDPGDFGVQSHEESSVQIKKTLELRDFLLKKSCSSELILN